MATNQAADMQAIDDFMRRTAPVTPEATAMRQSWMTWYPTLGFWDLNFSETVRDEASTRRNKFNLANTTNPKDRAVVENVIMTGFDANQMQGKPRKATLPSGEVGTQIKKPTPTAAIQGTHPVIKQGSKGEAVKEWQRILGTKDDGNFGPNTATLTRAFQTKKGLKADGVVGPATWGAALGAKAADAAPMPAEPPGFLSSLNPFSSSPATPAPAVASVIKPPAGKPAAKPPVTSPAKPKPAAATPAATSTPSAVASGGGTKPGPIQVAQAGMFGALDKVPLWAKIAGVVGAIGIFVFGREAKMVDYSTGREFKRSSKRRRAA